MKGVPMSDLGTWQGVRTTLEEYLEPSYYDKLLKPYVFSGREDIDLFATFVRERADTIHRVVELGYGTGRATECLLHQARDIDAYTGVDLSRQMQAWTTNRFRETENAQFVNSDSLDYLRESRPSFDLLFSLWSLSHSIHKHLLAGDSQDEIVDLMFEAIQNGNEDSTVYFLQFDALSDEQRILMKQWARDYPLFRVGEQSPAMGILDELWGRLTATGEWETSSRHLLGEPIVYASMDEALEVFLNFHLESAFNGGPNFYEVAEEIKGYLATYVQPNGEIHVRPGVFEFIAHRK
jgi:methyltransferase domain